MRRYEVAHPLHTQVLLESLLLAPLLVGDLASSAFFDRRLLGSVIQNDDCELNYSQKLGHLYEDALSYLLKNANGEKAIEVLGISEQIFNEKKITQGELDYLLKIGERMIHLELAVKFYLIHEQDGKIRFPGPDPRDDWDSKLSRLESHQLKMASSEHGRKFLLDKYGIENVEVQHLIYGKIFDHFSIIKGRKIKVLPRAVLADTATYPWIYLSEWSDFLDNEQARFIPKHLWPVTTSQYNGELLATLSVVERDDFMTSMEEYDCCQMIWSEQHETPIFLVPNHWPNIL